MKPSDIKILVNEELNQFKTQLSKDLQDVVGTSVEKYVNGKINKLQTDITDFHSKSEEQWLLMKPMLDIFNDVKSTKRVTKWILGLLMGVGGLIITIKAIWR